LLCCHRYRKRVRDKNSNRRITTTTSSHDNSSGHVHSGDHDYDKLNHHDENYLNLNNIANYESLSICSYKMSDIN